MSATLRLAQFIAGSQAASIPDEVMEKARWCMLDSFACALAGLNTDEMQRFRRALLAQDHSGPGRVWGSGEQCSLATAALINGALIHALDFDDSHKTSKTHPGAPVISAALSAAQLVGANSKELLEGVIVGYEVTLRIGEALGAGAHRLKGWHATSTCGNLGAAAAAARILRLTAEETASALGHAGTTAAGLWAFATDGAMSKKYHAGHSAWAGLVAVLLARDGFTGSQVILEAVDGGFFATFAPEVKQQAWESTLFTGLGTQWGILDTAYKPYPCCRTAHNAIDAILDLRGGGLTPERVEQIEIRTYDVAVRQCGYHDPGNSIRAMFSTPYLVAAAVRDGGIETRHFQPEQVHDPGLHALHLKVKVTFDEEMEALFPKLWACQVTVTTKTGEQLSRRVEIAKGDPKMPMTPEEHRRKFLGCASGVLDPRTAQAIVELTLSLGSGTSTEELIAALT
jgi:2-methylcitrate dehydratase PrpD